jgi:hypothetical protein
MENSLREYERIQVSKEYNYCLVHHAWQLHSWQINHESAEYKNINRNSMNLLISGSSNGEGKHVFKRYFMSMLQGL